MGNGRKIFISYKYADRNVYPFVNLEKTTVRSYVDKLEDYFEKTDDIYKGESDGEDLSKLTDDQIWEKLKDRIFDSSITIVMISPNMVEKGKTDKSQWIPWEISFSIKETTRNDRTSHSNAILAIALPDTNKSYDYIVESNTCSQCHCKTIHRDWLFGVLKNNMFNIKNPTLSNCTNHPQGNPVYLGEPSYIKIVTWEYFIANAKSSIESAIAIKDRIQDYVIQVNV